MRIKYIGGEVLGGMLLEFGKIYEVIDSRFEGKELAIYENENSKKIGFELWIFEEEIKKCFEIIE